jgi:hypothetical protein
MDVPGRSVGLINYIRMDVLVPLVVWMGSPAAFGRDGHLGIP